MAEFSPQAILPVNLARFGEQDSSEEQNDNIARNENAMNQNFSSLHQRLEAIEEFLTANG